MDKLYLLALQNIHGIGPVRAKNLIAYCGDAQAIFRLSQQRLLKIPNIGEQTAKAIASGLCLKAAEKELNFCEKNGIEVISCYEEHYPNLLKQIPDSPIILFKKGNLNLNQKMAIAVVGTRQATSYGKSITEKFVSAFAQANLNIVSGLAIGIDVTAHRAALSNKGSTTCVLAHGLDRIYPPHHKTIAQEMLENGAWLTEYPSNTQPESTNFPERNRIIAGMCVATLVIEARPKGGALITARIAFSKNREVYAVPGDINRLCAKGSNELIKQNIAKLVTEPEDILADLNLAQITNKPQTAQPSTLPLTPEEQHIVQILQEKECVIDELIVKTDMPAGKLFSILLDMEFKGIISQLPGKKFKLL
ncbi:MAG: DNA-processing protein DprA [Bacteroidia bacterium]|nr:DNA-processing protein DprA [Bacteroidia bacterium]MDW8301817.1 DNA-processing protein DprA [Bacteroidia bacterium]